MVGQRDCGIAFDCCRRLRHQRLVEDQETSPAKTIEQGIELIKDAAGKAIESRN